MSSSSQQRSKPEKESTPQSSSHEEVIMCELCGNPLDSCMCACPYCGKLDKCECCILDAVTGG
ncbi:MAG: hypothetical protein ABI361_07795 [Nitrososphaera sp.]